jgi:hypothetical protein
MQVIVVQLKIYNLQDVRPKQEEDQEVAVNQVLFLIQLTIVAWLFHKLKLFQVIAL